YHLANIHFLFQADDGIRDRNVTGVQTCALPICHGASPCSEPTRSGQVHRTRPTCPLRVGSEHGEAPWPPSQHPAHPPRLRPGGRSEERRVGTECRTQAWPWTEL